MLDPAAFEDIEADRSATIQSGLIVTAACVATGFAVLSVRALDPAQAFAIGLAAALGAWLIWAMLISAIGTTLLPEAETRSDPGELLRTIGFAAAPGIFYGFAALPAIAPFVVTFVSIWMIAATVVAVRQALDFHSTVRAVAVCATAWLIAMGIAFAIAVLFTTTVA